MKLIKGVLQLAYEILQTKNRQKFQLGSEA